MSPVRLALLFSQFGSYYASILTLVSTMLLARILTPDELGVVGIASSIIILADILKNAGMSSVLIREKELTERLVREALGVKYSIFYYPLLC